MAHILQDFVEQPHGCSYLSSETATLEVRVMIDVDPDELETMLERGWRRFGPYYFRPICTGCSECVTLRVLVNEFEPSKSQRRAAKKWARLRRVVGRPLMDAERLVLYSKWHSEREQSRGWAKNDQTANSYPVQFAFPHPAAREVAFYDGQRLVGIGLYDQTPRALSAVHFFYDPETESLGVANVVTLIEDARKFNLQHVYLGYRVRGCASLQYKAAYRPHELLVGRPGQHEAAVWRRVISQQ